MIWVKMEIIMVTRVCSIVSLFNLMGLVILSNIREKIHFKSQILRLIDPHFKDIIKFFEDSDELELYTFYSFLLFSQNTGM